MLFLLTGVGTGSCPDEACKMCPEQPPSLYSICFQKTFDILKIGLWNSLDPNPFSLLPSSIINDLTKLALSLPFRERPRITELLLLITSGRLTELDLIHHDLELNPNVFLKRMSKDVCKNLRSFSMPPCLIDADNPPVDAVLRLCNSLEDVHSAIPFDLDVLENCSALQNLRFHLPVKRISGNLLVKTGVLPKFTKSLRVFAACISDDSFSSSKFVARLLLSFPNLLSVGLVDSSLPIKLIYKSKPKVNLQLQMRKCFWGLSHESYLRTINTRKLSAYRKEFLKIIKLAVSSCPCIEELVINVFQAECLQYLCQLERLTFLSINFNYCDREYTSIWFSVLKQIGPQLKHLSVEAPSNIPINVICDNCPNLESLRIRGKATVAETFTSPNLPHLKRILLLCMDEKSLIYLVSKCPLLLELFLDCALCLDDDLLSKILKHNPLTELKVAGIHACKLSRLGLLMFLESAIKLEKVSFRSVKVDAAEVIIGKVNPKIVNYPIFNKLKDTEFFRRKLHPCRF